MKPGRNDPCSCGSGKKYKNCCLRKVELRPSAPTPVELEQLVALFNAGRHAEVESRTRLLLERYPDSGFVWKALGTSLQLQGKEALPALQKATELLSKDAEGHNNLGVTLRDQVRFTEAEASYRRALELNPDYAEAHNNLGLCLLATGRFAEGWPECEYRREIDSPKRSRPANLLPQWIGQKPSPNERLLVFEEQGLGDKLQFARYLELAAEQFAGGVSIVISSPLQTLFRRSFPRVEILDAVPADQRGWQWQCPLLSLPLAFHTTLETIPKQVSYLIPDPIKVARWQARIAALGLPATTRKIGVVWKTSSKLRIANLKAIALHQLSPLLNLPGCAWFSLQKEPDPDKASWVACGKLIDWAEKLGDFDETAALAMNMDLVISIDTSVVHLAGGLGLPTWLFNRHASEWRWMRDREDSPWYPTMRIFTQKKAGDWDEVVGRMAAELGGRYELPHTR